MKKVQLETKVTRVLMASKVRRAIRVYRVRKVHKDLRAKTELWVIQVPGETLEQREIKEKQEQKV